MKPLAVVMAAGLVLFFTASFALVGLPLIVVSGILLLALFVWMIQIQKTPRRDIRCPYCNNVNNVFLGVEHFGCDICERPVAFNEQGGPVPADGSLDNATPTSVYDTGQSA